MSTVEVEVHVNIEGVIRPLRLRFVPEPGRAGAWLEIGQISRRWSDDAGDHWLVMTVVPQRVYEVLRSPEGLWRAAAHGPAHTVV